MIKPINHNELTLAQPSVPAQLTDKQVIIDLNDTFNAHRENCVGMAANMIGVNKNIIIFEMGILAITMVNPEITSRLEAYPVSEGCLSLKGQRETIRYQKITVKYLDSNFKPQQQQFSGFVAQIIQHEIDHCNGILI
ncbi:peptide deformylase [Lentilactobacillus laojiaonis]|uniref:peptide deformylase n=1 Tax=Lentilactobacillus laojiaonis TaxID=2883998 RepID=UPI001D0A8F56|nr:peptide deformylase [Lentilactobacillus laojiaonis]UDM32188.1 peptide deformylase [Lentilactobacillus laojiaonis]